MYIFVPKSERIRLDQICTPLVKTTTQNSLKWESLVGLIHTKEGLNVHSIQALWIENFLFTLKMSKVVQLILNHDWQKAFIWMHYLLQSV